VAGRELLHGADSLRGGGSPVQRLRLRERLLRLGRSVKSHKPTMGLWWLLWMALGMLFFVVVAQGGGF
jgi:hypothetical protein